MNWGTLSLCELKTHFPTGHLFKVVRGQHGNFLNAIGSVKEVTYVLNPYIRLEFDFGYGPLYRSVSPEDLQAVLGRYNWFVLIQKDPAWVTHGPFQESDAYDFYKKHRILGEVTGCYQRIELTRAIDGEIIEPIDNATWNGILDAMKKEPLTKQVQKLNHPGDQLLHRKDYHDVN